MSNGHETWVAGSSRVKPGHGACAMGAEYAE